MPVVRSPKSGHRVTMTNYHLRDPALSLKAKGLLSQMLSLPPSWEYSLAGLAVINREGKYAIRTAIHELEKAGYLIRIQHMDNSGRFLHNEYQIYESPELMAPSCSFRAAEDHTEITRDIYRDTQEEDYNVWL